MSAATLGEGDEIIASINVTPLVDIMLVLLIIFMITTKMMQYPVVPIELPRQQNQADDSTQGLALMVDINGRLYVNGREATMEQAQGILASEVSRNPNVNVMLSGDGRVKYSAVMEVIDLTKTVGIKNLSLNVQFASVK